MAFGNVMNATMSIGVTFAGGTTVFRALQDMAGRSREAVLSIAKAASLSRMVGINMAMMGGAIAGAMGYATKGALDFDRAFSEVTTLIQDSSLQMPLIRLYRREQHQRTHLNSWIQL